MPRSKLRAEQVLEAEYLRFFEGWSWGKLAYRYNFNADALRYAVCPQLYPKRPYVPKPRLRKFETVLRTRLRWQARIEAAERGCHVEEIYARWGVL